MINRQNYIKWAEKNGMGINDGMAEMIFEGLEEKRKDFKVAYCPCLPPYLHGKDTICPCKPWKEGFKDGTLDICHCGLFMRKE